MPHRIPFPHPGATLSEDYLAPLGLSQHAVAHATGIPVARINHIVNGKRSITADTALRLSRFFRTTPQFWINLQTEYDLRLESDEHGADIEREVRPCELVPV